MNKKADYKYGIILSLILGLLVLSLSLFFIFNEYFTGDTADREVCRQSIQVRSVLPEYKVAGFNVNSFKDEFPLKCKTSVVDIDKSDVVPDKDGNIKAETIIADKMMECWALFDNGDTTAFPSKFYKLSSVCVPCARVHLTDEAKDFLIEEQKKGKKTEINIKRGLMTKVEGKNYNHIMYLRDSGKKFPALDLASSREFDLEGDEFWISISDEDKLDAIFRNRLTGEKEEGINVTLGRGKIYNSLSVNKVVLPEVMDPTKDDLLINYGIITSSEKGGVGGYIPFLFYFQVGQDFNPFDEVDKDIVDGPLWINVPMCKTWDGILA
jgi:hypothetical protein